MGTLAFSGHGPATCAVILCFLETVALMMSALDVGASGATLPSVLASSLVSRMDCFSSSSSCNVKLKLLRFSVKIEGRLQKLFAQHATS